MLWSLIFNLYRIICQSASTEDRNVILGTSANGREGNSLPCERRCWLFHTAVLLFWNNDSLSMHFCRETELEPGFRD